MDTVICPKCQSENNAKNLFCQSCGTSLAKPVEIPKEKPAIVNQAPVQPVVIPAPAAPPVQSPSPSIPPIMPVPASFTAQPPTTNIPSYPAGTSTPPQMGYIPPQPGYAYQAPMYMGTPVKDLGVRSDGWSDVIEGAADLADQVKQNFADAIDAENIVGVRVTEANLTNGQAEIRKYQLVHNGNGATIAVRVSPFGKNLFVGWDLYTRRTINWLTLGLLGGIVLLMAVFRTIATGYYFDNFFDGLFGFIGNFIEWLLVPSLAIMLLAKLTKDDWLAFFVTDLNEFAADDAVSLSTVVDNSLTKAVEEAKTPPAKTKK